MFVVSAKKDERVIRRERYNATERATENESAKKRERFQP